jgi:hypothetical protein
VNSTAAVHWHRPVDTEPAPDAQEHVGEDWKCCWDGCDRPAAYTITFHGTTGHVHDCSPHTAYLREWADVDTVEPLPCHQVHGTVWSGSPPGLR